VRNKQLAQHAGKFVKHVLPAAVKPVHSLWHEVLGFVFLAFAAIAGWKVFRNLDTMGPGRLALIIPFIIVTAAYGISSFLKARRISRS
jgi:TRAP-type C4-dicarboxylate transport system permease small subunit